MTKKAKPKRRATSPSTQIDIPEIVETVVETEIVGMSPLILNPFTEEAVHALLGRQQKAARTRAPKDVKEEMEKRLEYLSDGSYCINAFAFLKAIQSATRNIAEIKATHVRQSVFIEPDEFIGEGRARVRLSGTPHPYLEHVRNAGGGGADVRIRPMFKTWSAKPTFIVDPTMLSISQFVHLLTVAGHGVGVGDWRPEKSGMFGRFALGSVRVTEVKKEPVAA